MYKIIGADQKEYGPVTGDQLRQWLAEGRVNLQTQVLPDGASEWTTLGALPEFATASASTLPPSLGMAAPAFAPSAAGAEQVNAPAIGLLVFAIVGALFQLAMICINLAGVSLMAASQAPKEALANMFSGTIGVVFGIIAIIMSGVILLGALKMKKLESYGFAMTVSILAMVPCVSPCCFLGLPIGIWALIVLSKPEVKSAFH